MAIQTLNTIKQWFRTGFKPTQTQFWDTWDSFRHKYEKVPVKDIEGIDELFLSKADKVVLDNHLADKNAHAPQINTDWNSESGFSQLINKPEFKTINGEEIVGNGDINISSAIPTLDQVLNSDNKSLTQPIIFLDEEYSSTIDSRNLSIDGPLGESIQYNGDNISWTKEDKNLKLLFDRESTGQNIFSFPEMPHSTTPYKLATDQAVSETQQGIIDNTLLQELGGADKTLNGVRIGVGNYNVTTSTVLGRNALGTATAGSNVAIGTNVMATSTTANFNTGVGSSALLSLTTGTQNVGIGASSLRKLTTGNYNLGIGARSLLNLETGINNTAIGAGAGTGVTGSNNTALGYLANGNNASSTGNSNITLGYQAGSNLVSGSSNIIIESTNGGASLTTGNNNLILNPTSFRSGLVSGSGNTLIGSVSGLDPTDTNLIILSNGLGTVAIKKESDNTLLAPTLTNALINSGGAKSLVTKEYIDETKQISDNQISVSGNETVQENWNGQTIIFTGSGTITVPETLPAEFSFNAITMPAITLSWAITTPFVWTFGEPNTTPEKTYLNFTRVGSTNNIILSV